MDTAMEASNATICNASLKTCMLASVATHEAALAAIRTEIEKALADGRPVVLA